MTIPTGLLGKPQSVLLLILLGYHKRAAKLDGIYKPKCKIDFPLEKRKLKDATHLSKKDEYILWRRLWKHFHKKNNDQ